MRIIQNLFKRLKYIEKGVLFLLEEEKYMKEEYIRERKAIISIRILSISLILFTYLLGEIIERSFITNYFVFWLAIIISFFTIIIEYYEYRKTKIQLVTQLDMERNVTLYSIFEFLISIILLFLISKYSPESKLIDLTLGALWGSLVLCYGFYFIKSIKIFITDVLF